MTPKIERFLEERRYPTPYLVVDLERVAAKYGDIRRMLPLAEIHYAVKANPAPQILKTLCDLGSCFDAASAAEVELCLAAGAVPERVSYGNVVKKEAEIARAFGQGVRRFAFDSAEELNKIARSAPGARVYCRILTSGEGADWPLSRKFGCELDMARDLMVRAQERGLEAYGLSFHVGSQQTDPGQWEIAIGRTAMVFSDLRERGIEIKTVNLGGGFPVRYRSNSGVAPVPGFATFADAIMNAMTRHFGNHLPAMTIEPGRCIAAEAGVIEAEVVLISRKAYDDDVRWVFLDIGTFGGLAETLDEAIKYPIRTPSDGGTEGPVVIAGPTCDGADVLYERAGYTLPLELGIG
ncbi:MAG: type III PLP-dependent enzyme, partial [Rhodospirillales bacterium]|nr:type III PLP-dependent enzyme [Rhodospirillales bacterium]